MRTPFYFNPSFFFILVSPVTGFFSPRFLGKPISLYILLHSVTSIACHEKKRQQQRHEKSTFFGLPRH